jgi:hypothetical protein
MHRGVQRILRSEIEVARKDRRGGMRRAAIRAGRRNRGRCTVRLIAGIGVSAANRIDLRRALRSGEVFEVCGHHAQWARLREQGSLEHQARHAARRVVEWLWQRMTQDMSNRQTREQKVTETRSSASWGEQIDRVSSDAREARQQRA